jgi:DNA gyrase/topoisomerase IV subunit A
LMDKFGREKVQATDIFNSVASGLGIIANGISEGRIEAHAYTQAGQPPHSESAQQQKVTAVNLKLLQKRMVSREEANYGASSSKRSELLVLERKGRIHAVPLDGPALGTSRNYPVAFDQAEPGKIPVQVIASGDADERLLMVTSMYRFLISTPSNLSDLQDLGLDIGEFYQLKEDEYISSIGRWSMIKRHKKLLLVTSKGYVRTYLLDRLIESFEGPTPFKFDQPLAGLPLLVTGVDEGAEMVLLSDNGRGVRYPVDSLPTHGIQAYNRRDDERLFVVIAGEADHELALITSEGFGKRFEVDSIPEPPKMNSRGRVIVSRKPVVGMVKIAQDRAVFGMTGQALIPLDPFQLPLDIPTTTKSYLISEMRSSEPLLGLLTF